MEITKTNPDDYIASLPDDRKEALTVIDKTIQKALPGISRVMWEGIFWGGSDQKIIGYGDQTYYNSKKEAVEWFLIGLSSQKNYITIYMSATDGKEYLAKKYGKELGKVKAGSGAINFNKLSDIDLDKLTWLLGKAKESAEKLKEKNKK